MDDNDRTSMDQSKVKALESLGFVWAKRKGRVAWQLKYDELKQYAERFGHSNVPTKYAPHPALGRWVSTQRSQYKVLQKTGRSRFMTRTKIGKLAALGFRWEMAPNQSSRSDPNSAV